MAYGIEEVRSIRGKNLTGRSGLPSWIRQTIKQKMADVEAAIGASNTGASPGQERHLAALRALSDAFESVSLDDQNLCALDQIERGLGYTAGDGSLTWTPSPQQRMVIARVGLDSPAPPIAGVVAELLCAGVEDMTTRIGTLVGEAHQKQQEVIRATHELEVAHQHRAAALEQRDQIQQRCDELAAELSRLQARVRYYDDIHGVGEIAAVPTPDERSEAVAGAAERVRETVEGDGAGADPVGRYGEGSPEASDEQAPGTDGRVKVEPNIWVRTLKDGAEVFEVTYKENGQSKRQRCDSLGGAQGLKQRFILDGKIKRVLKRRPDFGPVNPSDEERAA